jgi:hypothetical protein
VLDHAQAGTGEPIDVQGLGEISLPDHDGHTVRLGELWQDRPAVLVWLRHYG